ncbi:MAG: hypothetical protein DRJ38_00370 [Thermoprotei archaeon]|nr:MAG: hypothetical protein DRJ38_00370 [Thermoprotei archaeon]
MTHLCPSCIYCYRVYETNRYGKVIRVTEHCLAHRNRRIRPPVTQCEAYMRALHMHRCGNCGKPLVEPPSVFTQNHAFCSQKCRLEYIRKKITGGV